MSQKVSKIEVKNLIHIKCIPNEKLFCYCNEEVVNLYTFTKVASIQILEKIARQNKDDMSG